MRNRTASETPREGKRGPTVIGHDDSTVTAFHRGSDMSITSYDRCKVTLFEDEPAQDLSLNAAEPPVSSKIDWTKWGTIFGVLSLITTILIAVLS
jgi:hypothetical protein